jgi:5'-nucleotidase
MCYTLPGPRCSPHAREELDAAIASGDKQAIKEAREAYHLTPRGIKELRAQGRTAEADRYAKKRKQMIEAAKLVQAMQPKIKVGLDLDNTTGDFTDGFRQFIKQRYSLSDAEVATRLADPTNYEYDISGWFSDRTEFRNAFHEAEADGLYGKMELYKGALDALQKLVKDGRVEVHVVTARDKQWEPETLAWAKSKALPFASLTHTEDKAKTNMDIYIDDAPHQLQNLRAGGKQVIAFNQLYNTDLDPSLPRVNSWDEVPAMVNVLARKLRAQQRKASQQAAQVAQPAA